MWTATPNASPKPECEDPRDGQSSPELHVHRAPGLSEAGRAKDRDRLYRLLHEGNKSQHDADGHSLGQFFVPPNDHGLSFLGVAFDHPIVAHVRIVYGNSILDLPEQDGDDVAVLDDFIYGEPQPIP